MLRCVTFGRLRTLSPLCQGCLSRYISSDTADEQGGFTRSIYSKPQYKHVVRDGKVVKIYTGLITETPTNFSDQMHTHLLEVSKKETLTIQSLHTILITRMRKRNRQRQIISDKEIENLGVDIAVARMVCRLGGRVQLVGQTEWIQSYYGIPPSLPNKYDDKFLLQTIDLSGTNIVYEGLEFLPCLTHLQYLRLRRCVHLDDFCLSRVGRIKGLQFLDVSECPSLTSKGLATLGQLKDLRRLIVSGNPQIKDKELVCLLLEDDLPKVYIDGVDYIGQLPSESKEKILQLVAAASTTTTTSDGDTEMSVHQSREKIQEGNEEEEEKVNKEEKVYLIDKA